MSKKKCNHLILHAERGWQYRAIRHNSIINQLFNLAKREWRQIKEQGYTPTSGVNPLAYLDRRTQYGRASFIYKYCPECGAKNMNLKQVKEKLKQNWTTERIIEDI